MGIIYLEIYRAGKGPRISLHLGVKCNGYANLTHLEEFETPYSTTSTLDQFSELLWHSKAGVISVISRLLDPLSSIQSIHLFGFM